MFDHYFYLVYPCCTEDFMIKEHALDDALVRRFEDYVNLYVEKFGITDWDIGITTCKSDTSDMANVAYVYPARAARIAIDTGFDVAEDEVWASALHEVLHLVLTDLREAYSKYLPQDDPSVMERIESLEHAVVNRIIHAMRERNE